MEQESSEDMFHQITFPLFYLPLPALNPISLSPGIVASEKRAAIEIK